VDCQQGCRCLAEGEDHGLAFGDVGNAAMGGRGASGLCCVVGLLEILGRRNIVSESLLA
jgi:hypothetical protein